MAWGAPKPHQDQPPPPQQTLGRARRGSHSAPWAEAELGWSVTRLQPPRVTCARDAGVRGDPQEDAALAGQADGLWSGRPRGGCRAEAADDALSRAPGGSVPCCVGYISCREHGEGRGHPVPGPASGSLRTAAGVPTGSLRPSAMVTSPTASRVLVGKGDSGWARRPARMPTHRGVLSGQGPRGGVGARVREGGSAGTP